MVTCAVIMTVRSEAEAAPREWARGAVESSGRLLRRAPWVAACPEAAWPAVGIANRQHGRELHEAMQGHRRGAATLQMAPLRRKPKARR